MTEIINKRQRYYGLQFVQYELLRAMKNREVMLMDRYDHSKVIRGHFISTKQYLAYLLTRKNWLNFYNNDYNIYISCAQYRKIPVFTINLRERSNETREWFSKKAWTQIYDYDLLLDFDAKESKYWVNMLQEVYKMLALLDQFKVKHYLIPSGSAFQIVIPGEILPFENIFKENASDPETKTYKVKRLVQTIKETFRFQYLDLHGVGANLKVMKCPYSCVGQNVVLPLRNLDGFSYSLMDINTVIKEVNLFKRGPCWRNNYAIYDNRKNMKSFLYKNCIEV